MTQVTVPVRLAWTSYEKDVNRTKWALDTKPLCQGLVVARSLLPEVGTKSIDTGDARPFQKTAEASPKYTFGVYRQPSGANARRRGSQTLLFPLVQ